MIVEQMEIGNFQVFCYILGDDGSGEGIVIDPGGSAEAIVARAQEIGVRTISWIVNTHGHVDHVARNADLQRLTGAPIAIHEADAPALSNQSGYALAMFEGIPSPPASRLLRDGDKIEFGRSHVEVIHTPGHTPGAICLYTPGFVITGDTLFVAGVGRTDLPGGSCKGLMQSIRTRLFTLPDETVVLPGHDYGITPTSTIAREKLENVFCREEC
ncbi:MAG: MBL fold metallo-hydrolase [Thermodesulfobacteriota bacterium]